METAQSKLQSGECKVVPHSSGKSPVWKTFSVVIESTTLHESGFVQCAECKKTFNILERKKWPKLVTEPQVLC